MKFIREFSKNWVDDFREIARFLEAYLPDECRIHHVGSTSIPNVPAKDIVDVDIECPQGSMSRVIDRLAEVGYEHKGNRGIPTREAFRPQEDSDATFLHPHHLYACESNSPELRRQLAFRDYLMAHPERAGWLAHEKRRADGASPTRNAYIDAKAAAYEAIAAEAMSWVSDREKTRL